MIRVLQNTFGYFYITQCQKLIPTNAIGAQIHIIFFLTTEWSAYIKVTQFSTQINEWLWWMDTKVG